VATSFLPAIQFPDALDPRPARQQICRNPEIRGNGAVGELVEDGLEETPRLLRSTSSRQALSQIDGRSQFPGPRALAPAQRDRLGKAGFRLINQGWRRGENKVRPHAQEFRRVTLVAVLFDPSDRLADERDVIGKAAGHGKRLNE